MTVVLTTGRSEWVNLSGQPVTVPPIGDWPASRVLGPGDRLLVDAPRIMLAEIESMLAGLGLVRAGSPQHDAHEAAVAEALRRRVEARDKRDAEARRWLAEHDVPEHVIAYLRDEAMAEWPD